MKGKVLKLTEGEKPVHCADCRNFKRNTSGRSFRIDTGEYFLGVCEVGVLTVGSPVKFADLPRTCDRFDECSKKIENKFAQYKINLYLCIK